MTLLSFVTIVYICAQYQILVLADGVRNQATATPNENDPVDFDQLENNLKKLNFYLHDFQNRLCQLDIQSHYCHNFDKESGKSHGIFPKSRNGLVIPDGYLNSDKADSKMTSEEIRAANAVLENLVEQRRAVAVLKKFLVANKADMENMLITKRDCRFRLGGHCITEALDRAASRYHYLKSPESPGRRRRDLQV